ncbi:YceI family protein [Lentisalinibacter orientalis]|uniref:YceI family protein n=1 Tax=Lentisalinibacter orientalis TaxID=2992241 RepID=UPI0038640215
MRPKPETGEYVPIVKKFVLTASTLAASLVLAAPAPAQQRCYAGDGSSGVLTFAGAVEDTGFTGSFGEFSVRYCQAGETPEDHEIRVTVSLASADSDNRDRDETLKGPEFFAVERHPTAVWQSTGVRREGNGYVADGELSLKGMTAPQSIRYELNPAGEAIIARGRFTMAGGTRIDRQRFDVGTGEFADPDFVRNEVVVEFEVTLSAQQEPPAG